MGCLDLYLRNIVGKVYYQSLEFMIPNFAVLIFTYRYTKPNSLVKFEFWYVCNTCLYLEREWSDKTITIEHVSFVQ